MKKVVFLILFCTFSTQCFAAQFCINIEDDQVERATAGITQGGTVCQDGEDPSACAIRKVAENIIAQAKEYESRKAYQEASDNYQKITIS